jgi:hypothetical protein
VPLQSENWSRILQSYNEMAALQCAPLCGTCSQNNMVAMIMILQKKKMAKKNKKKTYFKEER